MNEFRQVEQIAFHEAGHAVFGHFFDYQSEEIRLNFDEKRGIYPYTLKNYGSDKSIIDNFENEREIDFNKYSIDTIQAIAKKYCVSLLAGPITEFYYKKELNFKGQLDFQNTPDYNNVLKAIRIAKITNIQSFLSDISNIICSYIETEDVIWNTISEIAKLAITQTDFVLPKNDIYKIFKHSGLDDLKATIK
ncbi:MAG: hypothetical protein JXL97_19940 [Bacteroidales bacterium]|nr:hypothetical protein [Bacteroidales bacterium]